MRVFVTGTGRCGSLTFSKACRHITNFSSGHETKAGKPTADRLVYPDQHIEVDAALAWMLGVLISKYPNAVFVHLERERDLVVDSWFHRGVLPNRGAAPLIDVIFQTDCKRLKPGAYRTALGLLYDNVNANIRFSLEGVRSLYVPLHDAKMIFEEFWNMVGAAGDLAAAQAEFNIRYNAR